MAKADAVWGIDVGQCSLKALRCRAHEQPDRVIADAFDFIEYPKILSQPGAEPAELVREAIKQFLSRNSVRGDRVAISVSGQNGLARFIKLPPVEAKKIPDIVRYEARQQIPFDLQDVVWDYQRMGGGSEEEGFALETEIGLFAMKRAQVERALEPFDEAGIEVDYIQLTPLALYNCILFDQMQNLPPVDQYDPEDPPPSTVILSLGTDATDLVVTNGYRVWQRSIPLGGNHFTKALTKELKLTFAKAEHLKRNASTSQDPKALFQAMRPVFSDLLTEIQRSIGYFTSVDRTAKISHIIALGNAMKMPGLRRYLSQSLGIELIRIEAFRGLTGAEVLAAPAFKDNMLGFGVCYGLAVQGLGLGRGTLRTNLLPREKVKDRFIREKKPWAVAAVALLLLGCTISYASYGLALNSVKPSTFSQAESQTNQVAQKAATLASEAQQVNTDMAKTDEIGKNLIGNIEGRRLWLELWQAITSSLPPNEPLKDAQDNGKAERLTPEKMAEKIMNRNELHIIGLECRWDSGMQMAGPEGAGAFGAGGAPGQQEYGMQAGSADASGGETSGGVEGPHWVITLRGYHYHNPPGEQVHMGAQYVRETLVKNLKEGKIRLPAVAQDNGNGNGADGEKGLKWVTNKELGISHVEAFGTGNPLDELIDDPYAEALKSGGAGGPQNRPGRVGMDLAGGGRDAGKIKLKRYDFEVQFFWKPTLPTEREKKAKEAAGATGSDQASETR